jgi:hypothetical protein
VIGEFRAGGEWLTLFSEDAITVDGRLSLREGVDVRPMFELLDPADDTGSAWRWLPDVEIDEARWLSAGEVRGRVRAAA